MLRQLPNVHDNFTVPFAKWNHLDFLYANDADKYLFPRLFKNMKSAEEKYGRNEL